MGRALPLLLILSGCSGTPKSGGPPPSTPTVEVAVANQSILGTQVLANASVEGCASISTLSLSDHGQVISTVTNAPVTSQFTLTEQELQPLYAIDGIAATLDLVATVTCSDGLTAMSPGTGVVFMPADDLYPGTFSGTQFSIEPDASGLVQCVGGEVSRLDTAGNTLASTGTQLPYACSDQGFLVRGAANELYWVEPNTTFSRLNQDLAVMNTYGYAASSIYLPPDGQGFAVASGAIGQGVDMFWVDRSQGTSFNSFQLNATIDGVPALGQEGLVVPIETEDSTSNVISLGIEVWNLTTASLSNQTILANLNGSTFGTTPIPLLSLAPDGSRAYFVGGTAQNMVYACAIDLPCTDPTQGGGLIYLEQLAGGPYTAAVPTGSSLIVVGPSAAQFLNLATGATVGTPIAPSGSLNLLEVVPGPGASTYLLSGDSSGNILEVIILDAPAHEAARYTIPTAGFGFDLDSASRAYILQGTLASLLLPSDYASARQ